MSAPVLHYQFIWRDLQEINFVESVKGPEYVVPRLHLLLTAAYRRELVVEEQAPEHGRGFGGSGNGGNEVVVEILVEGAVVWELGHLGRGIKGISASVAWGRVGSKVGTVA